MTDRELERDIQIVEHQIDQLWQEGLTSLMLSHRQATDRLQQGQDDEVCRVLELGFETLAVPEKRLSQPYDASK
jgi:hypothetical protein